MASEKTVVLFHIASTVRRSRKSKHCVVVKVMMLGKAILSILLLYGADSRPTGAKRDTYIFFSVKNGKIYEIKKN